MLDHGPIDCSFFSLSSNFFDAVNFTFSKAQTSEQGLKPTHVKAENEKIITTVYAPGGWAQIDTVDVKNKIHETVFNLALQDDGYNYTMQAVMHTEKDGTNYATTYALQLLAPSGKVLAKINSGKCGYLSAGSINKSNYSDYTDYYVKLLKKSASLAAGFDIGLVSFTVESNGFFGSKQEVHII